MKRLIYILYAILLSLTSNGQDADITVDFNQIEIYEIDSLKGMIPIGQRDIEGEATFYEVTDGFIIFIDSKDYTLVVEGFHLKLETTDAFGIEIEENSTTYEVWQLESRDKDFIVYLDKGYKWVYLYLTSINEYITFKLV